MGGVAERLEARSPWRRAKPGVLVALVVSVIDVTLGAAVSAAYFVIVGLAFALGAVVLVLALFCAMRPALRRPTEARTGYHWTTFFLRRMGDPRAKRGLDDD